MTDPLPPKKDVARALLLRGNVFVHLDPRLDDVCVPDWLRDQPQLVLQVGLDLPLPIPDLRVDDRGVSGTLSFQRSPFRCEVPWSAVFALVGDDGRGMVWPDDLPQEIAREVDHRVSQDEAGMPEKPLLSAIKADGGSALPAVPEAEAEPRQTAGGRPLPPYLRVVK